MATEQELLAQLNQIEYDIKGTKSKIVQAKKTIDNAESKLIELRLAQEKLTTQLQNIIALAPETEPTEVFDIEVARFRKEHPELCEWARKRDEKKKSITND